MQMGEQLNKIMKILSILLGKWKINTSLFSISDSAATPVVQTMRSRAVMVNEQRPEEEVWT